MNFRPWLYGVLLAPAALVLVPYLYALMVMWTDPASSLQERGANVLLVAAMIAFVVALVAVPMALFVLWREPAARTPRNLLATAAGMLPLAIGAMLWFVLLYGHR